MQKYSSFIHKLRIFPKHLHRKGNQGIISPDMIRAEVRMGDHTISRSDYGIISEDIIPPEWA